MAGSVNKVEEATALYVSGTSLRMVGIAVGVPTSTVRGWLLSAGVKLRSRAEGVSCLLYTSPSPRD